MLSHSQQLVQRHEERSSGIALADAVSRYLRTPFFWRRRKLKVMTDALLRYERSQLGSHQ